MIDCGCKGKKKYQTHLGDEVLNICIDCAEQIYKVVIERSIEEVVKGGAKNGLLRRVDDSSKALQEQS